MYDPMGLYRSLVGDALSAIGLNQAADYVDNMADAAAWIGDTWSGSTGDELYNYSQDREAGADVKGALDVAETYVPGADRITQPLKGLVDVYQGNGSGAMDVALGMASGKNSRAFGGKATDVAAGVAKNPPNPNGKRGGALHQELIKKVREMIQNRGNKSRAEQRVDTPDGKKKSRYVDEAELDKDDNVVRYHQVGKQNKDGTPVKRERDAMDDINGSNDGSVPIDFHPYNTCPAPSSTGAGS
jgi:hypothetical protein